MARRGISFWMAPQDPRPRQSEGLRFSLHPQLSDPEHRVEPFGMATFTAFSNEPTTAEIVMDIAKAAVGAVVREPQRVDDFALTRMVKPVKLHPPMGFRERSAAFSVVWRLSRF